MQPKVRLYTWEEMATILKMWADEQEPWANDYWMPDKKMQEGYKRALIHLRHKLDNPITHII